MKRFVFIVTDRNRKSLHVGMSSDLLKTVDFYKQMPNLFFDSAQQLSRLVYFEELNNEESAIKRFEVLSKFTRSQKEKQIRDVNPDWFDLALALEQERILLAQEMHFHSNRKAA